MSRVNADSVPICVILVISQASENLVERHHEKLNLQGRERLVKVEQKLAERVRRKLLETCVCTKVSYFESVEPEKLEKEMNVPCPAHEFRSLSTLNRAPTRQT